MSVAVEMREAIIELGGNRALFDSRERWLERAARSAGISPRMAKTFFYNEKCNPSAEVVDLVRRARDNLRAKARKNAHSTQQLETVDVHVLEERLRRIEDALRLSDQDAYRALVNQRRDPAD